MFKKLTILFSRSAIALVILLASFENINSQIADNYYHVDLSAELLQTVKEEKDASALIKSIAALDPDSLKKGLKSPIEKNAFWVNIYNAFIQIVLSEEAGLYKDRSEFFSKDRIVVAGDLLSFDDIEHGILRASTWKYSLGYIKNPFAPEIETKYRLSKTDKRIHFALNCGAVSCPPIAIYTAENYNSKINEVAAYYLKKISDFNEVENKVYTTPLFSWFRGDFDGSSGIRKTLVEYGVLKKNSDATIEYKEYDWTLDLKNYYE